MIPKPIRNFNMKISFCGGWGGCLKIFGEDGSWEFDKCNAKSFEEVIEYFTEKILKNQTVKEDPDYVSN